MSDARKLDLIFAALANETRRDILAILSKQPATVNELAKPFDMTLPAVSKHIRVLEGAGLIIRGKEAQYRPCSLNAAPLESVASWTEQYRHIWETRFDRLDSYLIELKERKNMGIETNEKKWATVEREFDAPIDVVWSMWTDPEHFKNWYGPRGMDVPVAEMDLRVGGTRKVCMAMNSPERSMKMWTIGVFKEISAPNRLIYTESMCEEDGTLISPVSMGMPEDHPDFTEVIIELEEVQGKTRMKMVHVGVVEGTAGAGGWNQAFEKMSEYLSKLSQ